MPRGKNKSTPRFEGNTLYVSDTEKLMVGTPSWDVWLNQPSNTRFYYIGAGGTYTARREQRKSNYSYWIGYRKVQKHLYRVVIGSLADLTIQRLAAVADQLNNKIAQAGAADLVESQEKNNDKAR